MIISSSPAYVFVHIPKTAGTSLSNSLKAHSKIVETGGKKRDIDYHATARQLREYVGTATFETAYKFSFVRNPWGRLVSWYFFLQSHAPNLIGDQTFEDWVLRGAHMLEGTHMEGEPLVPGQRRPQLSWLEDENQNLMVDFVGKVETLEDDFAIVCDKLGFPPPDIPRMRTSSHGEYQQYYTQEMIDFVRNHYARDIEKFGYEF
ncbi:MULTISPECIES: sulfotransferase family 2 domain-containing protein [Hyphomonas]|uniref:sulfotransferase family 2 domain-containing protein n=1 Tax=Hyphomonas TaxID=85 RepID=UPI003513903D